MTTIQEKVAIQYLAAKQAVEMADKAMATAKKLLEETYAEMGVTDVTIDGVKVAIVEATEILRVSGL